MEIHGYCESFNGKLGDELLKREIFYSLKEVQVLSAQWRREYRGSTPVEIHEIRPHSSLGYRPLAPAAVMPAIAHAAALT
jgi:transposase InsO family protein